MDELLLKRLSHIPKDDTPIDNVKRYYINSDEICSIFDRVFDVDNKKIIVSDGDI